MSRFPKPTANFVAAESEAGAESAAQAVSKRAHSPAKTTQHRRQQTAQQTGPIERAVFLTVSLEESQRKGNVFRTMCSGPTIRGAAPQVNGSEVRRIGETVGPSSSQATAA